MYVLPASQVPKFKLASHSPQFIIQARLCIQASQVYLFLLVGDANSCFKLLHGQAAKKKCSSWCMATYMSVIVNTQFSWQRIKTTWCKPCICTKWQCLQYPIFLSTKLGPCKLICRVPQRLGQANPGPVHLLSDAQAALMLCHARQHNVRSLRISISKRMQVLYLNCWKFQVKIHTITCNR